MAAGDQLAVENREDGMQEGPDQAHQEAPEVAGFQPAGDEKNAGDHDGSAQDLTGSDPAPLDEGFGEGGKQGNGGEG
ncbi:MAG: hypothetical protein GWO24_26370, partial [Akkermansiaceae bacterium]|nr:hypothetical protein [Akkermansiaceae bacterium]